MSKIEDSEDQQKGPQEGLAKAWAIFLQQESEKGNLTVVEINHHMVVKRKQLPKIYKTAPWTHTRRIIRLNTKKSGPRCTMRFHQQFFFYEQELDPLSSGQDRNCVLIIIKTL